MTIIEALRSGKRFKREHEKVWSYPTAPMSDGRFYFSKENILAEDWMIEDDVITLTKQELKNILVRYKDQDLNIDSVLGTCRYLSENKRGTVLKMNEDMINNPELITYTFMPATFEKL